jgi:molybdenum cofactor synthesis domain-containing protein
VLDTVRDESGREAPVRLVFEPKSKNQDQEEFSNLLLAHTSLENNVGVNLVMIGNDGKPRQKSLGDILREWIANREVDCVITTGGTGITGRDVTPEAFSRVLEKEIQGFGELFRMLSYQKIGTSTIQSRAIGGVAGGTYLFALPVSNGAVKDAWDDILVHQLDSRNRPCNFVELMPRLREV